MRTFSFAALQVSLLVRTLGHHSTAIRYQLSTTKFFDIPIPSPVYLPQYDDQPGVRCVDDGLCRAAKLLPLGQY